MSCSMLGGEFLQSPNTLQFRVGRYRRTPPIGTVFDVLGEVRGVKGEDEATAPD